MAIEVNNALSRAYEELRTLDMEISTLSGIQDRFSRKRAVVDSNANLFSSDDRRLQDGSRRIIVGPENSVKRGRYGDEHGPKKDSFQREREYSPPSRTHRSLSSVVMPTTIETKSRAAIINEMKRNEKKEDTVRNRRLFSNLLVGTLRQFQKEEKTVGNKGLAQIEKQKEVERRLEETEKENRERLLRERDQLMAKRREKEIEIQALRRQKAIEQSAEEKIKHFSRLQCFIQTQTKPPLFFLPAKHTLRTLELLKDSSKKIGALIELRREEMNRELKRLESFTSSNQTGREMESDQEDDFEKNVGLKSAVVVKSEQPTAVDEKQNETNEHYDAQEDREDDEGQPNRNNGTDSLEESRNKEDCENVVREQT